MTVGDVQILNAGEKEEHLTKIRAAHRAAFDVIDASDTDADVVVICSIKRAKGLDGRPAVCLQVRERDGNDLHPAVVAYIVCRTLQANVEGSVAPPAGSS